MDALAQIVPWLIVALLIIKDFLQYREDSRKPILEDVIGFVKMMFFKEEPEEDLEDLVDKFKKKEEA